MSIEKDLKQNKPFETEFQRALVNLLFTSRYLESQMKSHYKAQGITMKQYNILRILKGATEPLSTQQIGERMIDRMSDISRIVDRMVHNKIVKKSVNRLDKRLVDISVTKKGLHLLDVLADKHIKAEDNLGNMSADEAKTLNILLDKIRGYN